MAGLDGRSGGGTGPAPRPYPQTPLGGTLVDRVLTGDELLAARERAQSLPRLMIDTDAAIAVEMLATGVFSPLVGAPSRDDNESVVECGRLLDGTPWPVPLSFSPAGRRNARVMRTLQGGEEVALIDHRHEPVALMRVDEVYPLDRDSRALNLFRTKDPRVHPGVEAIYRRMSDLALAGPVQLIERTKWGAFERYRHTPRDTFDLFYRANHYRRVAGFVTGANPPHMGHEYMHRVALEVCDALCLMPQVEMERPEYIKAHHRVMALEALMDVYYPPQRVVMAAMRTNYLFAGPREAILHVLIMRNHGCTHALIGRDHAAVGDLYDMFASQRVFDMYRPGELGVSLLFFGEVFYCTRCRSCATEHTCPHDSRYRLQISGTGIREVLRRGFLPPKEICRPEVAHIAMQGVEPQGGAEGRRGVYPVGQTVHSLFPYYEAATRLGGYLRPSLAYHESLGERDLEAALLDARSHADQVYADVFSEVAAAAELDRSLTERWRVEAREILVDHQAGVVERLQEKLEQVEHGVEEPTGQTSAEIARELRAAAEVLRDHPRPLHPDRACWRQHHPPDDEAPPVWDGAAPYRGIADAPADAVPGPFDLDDEVLEDER